jgi:hypothetical protein
VRWRAYELPDLRAGAPAEGWIALENAGTASWNDDERGGVRLSYHWLDELGNPIFWDGVRTTVPGPIVPGAELELTFQLRGPIPPGRYLLAIDLVDEFRCWFAEVGNQPLELAVEIAPRLRERALAVRMHGDDPATAAALAVQTEPLVPEAQAEAIAHLAPGCLPGPDWSTRVLDAHASGYAVVAGSIAVSTGALRRAPADLAPYARGSGRIPGFSKPLLCPSALVETELAWTDSLHGLPAALPPEDEPWVFDGRIELLTRVNG